MQQVNEMSVLFPEFCHAGAFAVGNGPRTGILQEAHIICYIFEIGLEEVVGHQLILFF
jgi:hypothetical protein